MRDLSVASGLRVRYTESTGRTRVDIEPAALRALRDAAMVGGDACCFWACPGPDTDRIKSYYTCRNCAAIIQIRRALRRFGVNA
jgi:hypothetical protein